VAIEDAALKGRRYKVRSRKFVERIPAPYFVAPSLQGGIFDCHHTTHTPRSPQPPAPRAVIPNRAAVRDLLLNRTPTTLSSRPQQANAFSFQSNFSLDCWLAQRSDLSFTCNLDTSQKPLEFLSLHRLHRILRGH